jgi:hypothetical protein
MNQEGFTVRSSDDAVVDQHAARVGYTIDSIGDWDSLTYTLRGRAPFSLLMDYAAGLAAWTWRTEHATDSARDQAVSFDLATPVLCLIALAGYRLAAGEGIYEADRVPLEPAAVLLSDDQQARQLTTIEPGNPLTNSGRLRPDDRQQLQDAVQSGSSLPWQQWREQAAHVVNGHLNEYAAASAERGAVHAPTFRSCLWQVRQMSIRRGWYDHPDLPVQHAQDAPTHERC